MSTASAGLRGVVVGESTICDVQPEGNLYYRGYNIHDLADNATFEEVVYLLWNSKLPTKAEFEAFTSQLKAEYTLPDAVLSTIRTFPKNANSMDALRAAVAAIGMSDPDTGDNSPEANARKALRLQAKIGTAVAAIERLHNGQEPVAPRTDLGLAANFLYMLNGKEADELSAKTMDIDFILHAEHELNASTFAARVTVSTHADLNSGMTSGLGALSGPRHGAAAEETMEMLLAIGSVDAVDGWVRPKLSGESRTPIPGFGHAVYRAPDPRATHLREMSRQLGEQNGDTKWFDMTTKIEQIVDELTNTPERLAAGKPAVYANVDCFSASCYHMMNLDKRLFTPMFAIARTSGWCAHMMEQFAPTARIIRPRLEYTGKYDIPYVPIADR
jgi:citrate synthase